MTIPTLPTDKTTGDVIDDTHVDDTTAGLAYWGKERPNARMEYVDDGNPLVAHNTQTTVDDWGNSTIVQDEANVGETFWDILAHGNDRFVIPVTGRYDLFQGASWQWNATGHRRIGYKLNGGTVQWVSGSQAGQWMVGGETCIEWTAADTIDFYVWQNSGADLELWTCWWSICLVSGPG